MRRFLLIALCLPAIAAAQGVRFDQYNMTSANNVPFGAQAPIYTLPSSKVTVCAYPDDGGQPCGNVIPIYSDPALTQTADNPITADVHGRFGLWLAPGTYTYSVVTQGGVFLGTYIFTLGGSGSSSGGCSTGGIATTNGSVTGDNSSTNCGYNNRVGDTVTSPALVSTFGSNLLNANSGAGVTAIGTSTGTNNGGAEVVMIGDATGVNNIANHSDFIGQLSGNISSSGGVAGYEDCLGYSTCRNMDGGGNYFVGIGAFATSGIHSMHDVIGIGQAAANDRTSGDHVIGIGDGAAGGLSSVSPSTGVDVIGIGQGAAGAAVGTSIVAIGRQAGQNTTANDLVALGDQVCKALSSGSANVFCLGHNITGTGVVTNAIAIGNGIALITNGTVIGDSSTTEAHIYGTFFTPASSSAACTVPEFADDANFHYVCTATNTWKRVALSSF